ncbi:hypothetical protein A2U01_0104628, partial [Trifolium medium]|nr:hypothetical protein [Trifolium medium]
AFTAIFLWKFKQEWRVILPLPDDEEDTEFEPQKLTSSVVEQSTVVEFEISGMQWSDALASAKASGHITDNK